MKTFTPQELQDVLSKHALWLRNEPGGECANLACADLRYANLTHANLVSANLTHANLERANLIGANLERAYLERANLERAYLCGARLERAYLCGARLVGANLVSANLYGANLSNTILAHKTILNFNAGKNNAFYMGTNLIQIGCKAHPIKHWLSNFEKIGKENNYTPEQIKKYGEFIKICAQDYRGSNPRKNSKKIKKTTKKTTQRRRK